MQVIMLSWEYPPKIVGGLSRHVYDLSHALANQGVQVDVITGDHPDAPSEELNGNLSVYRVPVPPGNDFVHWVHNLNAASEAKITELLNGKKPARGQKPKFKPITEPTVIHAHDWLSEFAGKALKQKLRLPMVATIHATEHGRNHGIHNDLQRYISGIEWELCYEAWRVICCSHYMRDEISRVLEVPADKLDIIPNGIDPSKFDLPFDKAEFRKWFARPEEKIVFFVGRMVPEKGVQVLIEAAPEIIGAYNDVKFVIAGGGDKSQVIGLAESLGVSDRIFFTGYIDDETLLKLYNVIDVAVYPSLYEPFGIVALEAMAAKVPVVVTDVGGLREVVDHGVSGLTAWADNPDSLAWALVRILKNPYSARAMANNAYRKVMDQFNWGRIAEQTSAVYDRVWSEYWESEWRTDIKSEIRNPKYETKGKSQKRNAPKP
jgi:glycogen(starch) synthase